MSEHSTTIRHPEPDDVFLLTKHLLVKQPEQSRSISHPEHDEPDIHQPLSMPKSGPSAVGRPGAEVKLAVTFPLSDVVGHLVYGRVISQEDAEGLSPGFAAYLRILSETENNAYDRDIGGGTISRVYLFGKALSSTPLTSPAISLSSALRLPDETWRKAAEDAWALIPEAYKATSAFKGPDIMLLVTNVKARA